MAKGFFMNMFFFDWQKFVTVKNDLKKHFDKAG